MKQIRYSTTLVMMCAVVLAVVLCASVVATTRAGISPQTGTAATADVASMDSIVAALYDVRRKVS